MKQHGRKWRGGRIFAFGRRFRLDDGRPAYRLFRGYRKRMK